MASRRTIYPVFLPFAGCAQRCSFCDQGILSGQSSRLTPLQVQRQLEAQLPTRGQGEVAFYGGTFTLLPAQEQQAYLEVAAALAAAGRVDGSRVSTRPDTLDEAAIERLVAGGCRTVELGCQSFSPQVLQAAGRNYSAATIAGAVDRLRRRGLRVGLQLMPGLPQGDRAEALSSLVEALRLRPDFLRIYPTVVVAGTGLETAFRQGTFRPWSLEAAVDCCAAMLWHCQKADIPVIRLGLQSQAVFDRGEGVLAGPYHPAFGQLVKSRLWAWGLGAALELDPTPNWWVHPFDLPDALGHRRENLAHLGHQRPHYRLGADPGLGRGQLRGSGTLFNLIDLVTPLQRNLTA
jgi:histone acetyltransferase (RNA polymerase elongator complex component)